MPEQRATVITTDCDRCGGTGKEAAEWDLATSAIVAFKPCCSCLGRGQVRVNAPTGVALEPVAA